MTGGLSQSAAGGGVFAPGSLFAGRYRIERLLGAGGMGAVYQAWDSELGVSIALKVIRSDITSDPEAARDFERRFKQELLLARQVSHPNVVRIHDLGDAAGVKYITMSYVVGSDLCAVLKPGALPIGRARGLALQLASGIAAAHDAGIVHRDLKPQNILIDSRDQLYISDFGLAKSLEATTAGLTRTGEFLGTPRYISPEQVEGRPVDHRGDLYAVGLILYEMVTGEAPFAGPSAIEQMLQRVKDQPKPARRANPQVPEYLERIIMRCLERDPAQRYQSAHEIAADLKAEQSTASTVGAPRRTVSLTLPVPTSRTWPIAAAALVLLLLTLLIIPQTRRLIWPAGSPGAATPAAAAPIRIAVMPFGAPEEAPALAEIAAGVEEGLQSKLSQLRRVTVASATAVRRAAPRKTLELVGREVGATLVVTGAVAGDGERVRITASLDDVAGRGRVWSQEFSGLRADLLTIEGQIFNALTAQLDVAPSSSELAGTMRGPTADIDAYAAYLKGRRAMRGEQDIDNVKAALGFYEEATRIDPRFALAYTGIADASIRLYRNTKDATWAQRAESAALHAQSIDDSLPEVHVALGNVYLDTGKSKEAIVELKRAADLAPIQTMRSGGWDGPISRTTAATRPWKRNALPIGASITGRQVMSIGPAVVDVTRNEPSLLVKTSPDPRLVVARSSSFVSSTTSSGLLPSICVGLLIVKPIEKISGP